MKIHQVEARWADRHKKADKMLFRIL